MKSGRHSKYPSSLAGGIYRGFAARKVPLPILLAASPLACRLCRENFISCALTIPPATQAKVRLAFFSTTSTLKSDVNGWFIL